MEQLPYKGSLKGLALSYFVEKKVEGKRVLEHNGMAK